MHVVDVRVCACVCVCVHSGGNIDQLIIVPANKNQKRQKIDDGNAAEAAPAPLSKGQLRKLKQIEQKKERRDNMMQVRACDGT